MEQTIPAGNPVKTFRKIEAVLTPEKVAETADQNIALLSHDPRWEAMMTVIDGMIDTLESLEGIEPTDTTEAIGMKFLVSRLASGPLKILRDLPDNIANSNGAKE